MATKEDIILREMKTPEGRKRLAASMQEPLRFFLDYEGVGRKAFQVSTLAQGQVPVIDADVEKNNLAYMVANKGQDIMTMVDPETYRVQLFEIASNPSIDYTQLAQRMYNLQSRVEQVTRSEIMRVEDRKIFQTLRAVGTHKYQPLVFQKDKFGENPIYSGSAGEVTIPGNPVNPVTTVARAQASLSTLSTAIAEIEKHGGLKAQNIFMNPYNMTILREMNKVSTGYYIDFETSRELLKTGYVASVYGLSIYVTPELPKDEIIVTAAPEFTGRILESIPLTVIPYDNPEKRTFNYSIFESIGIICHNARAVSCIKLT